VRKEGALLACFSEAKKPLSESGPFSACFFSNIRAQDRVQRKFAPGWLADSDSGSRNLSESELRPNPSESGIHFSRVKMPICQYGIQTVNYEAGLAHKTHQVCRPPQPQPTVSTEPRSAHTTYVLHTL